MSDADRCGYPTDESGDPCKNSVTDDGDPDRCWIDAHNASDVTDHGQPGRPSKFNDERARDAIEAARQSKSLGGCARAAGISKQGFISRWLENEDLTFTDTEGRERRFVDAFADAREDGETVLVQGGLRNDNVDTSMAKFLLSTSYDYVKTERRELTGEDGGPVETRDLSAEEKAQLDDAFDTEPET
jgi:hypothetical protein